MQKIKLLCIYLEVGVWCVSSALKIIWSVLFGEIINFYRYSRLILTPLFRVNKAGEKIRLFNRTRPQPTV